MSTLITLDKAGRVVIPKPVRDELHLAAGDSFELENVGEQIVLRPIRQLSPLVKKQGVWVLRTGAPLSVAETNRLLHSIRDERDLDNAGLE